MDERSLNQTKLQDAKSKATLPILGCVAIAFVGLNLRPGIVGVAPLVPWIRDELALTATAIGLLTAIPLICFALISPLVPFLAKRWKLEQLITAALVLLILASAARGLQSQAVLFVATAFVGVAIAVGNVAVPAIVKSWFPNHFGIVTGIYSVSLFAGAAIAGGLAAPMAQFLSSGWNGSLASWGILAAVALLIWLFATRGTNQRNADKPRNNSVWRSPLAWWVTAYMGFQSLHYFTVAAWLPEIIHTSGHSTGISGMVLAACNVSAMVMALVTPIVASRYRSQGVTGVALAVVSLLGLLMLLILPGQPFVAGILLGIGQGGAIGLALLLIGVRAGTPAIAAALSGMSQCIGYLLAAVGAPLMGAIYESTSNWIIPIAVLCLFLILQSISAVGAGRQQTVADSQS